ncbi:MAG TPA: glycosyltransferase family 39 protein [Edaphobacter sp.]|nr:glycosyltransferase family 39 protein [Edaphobacter sp.]
MDNKGQTTPPSSLQDLCRQKWKVVSTLLATALACIVLLTLLGHKPLTNWDEGIYAEISREMLSLGVLVPHWNYQPWFEKPPLMFWITAAFFKLFGVGDFWARAGSAFSGVAIVGLLHGWLLRRNDILAAWLSTLILLSTFGFLHVCRVGEMDVLLSLGCCIALFGLTAIQERERNGWYLFWAGLAIALMTKGAACIVLIIAALLFAAIERWNASRFGRRFWLGLALFLLAVLPWHLSMFHLFGAAFLSEYLGFHVLARATHQIEEHITHWWYYFWVLLLSAAPFVLFYPFAIAASFRRKELRAWSIFALVVITFFTIVQTRLPHYIAPAYPALAMLTSIFLADRLKDLRGKSHQSAKAFWTTATILIIAICVASAFLTSAPRRTLHQATVGPNVVYAEKESISLLRDVFSKPQPVSGPLLAWWEGNARSIATSVFYSHRPVQQVQLDLLSPAIPTDKYLFQPETLKDALSSGPRLILLDKYLVPRIPREFAYRPIASGRSMEVGIIERR